MSIPRTVADVLDRHVSFEVESIDRMYLNVYQPRLQYERGAASFFTFHRGQKFASSALMAPMTRDFVAAIDAFVQARGLDMVAFTKGERKDDLTAFYLAHHDGSEGVLYVGKAQEKATVIRTERRRNALTGVPYAWLVKASALVNHYYFYCFDDDFGPFFIKFCSYFPYTAKLCINGNEYAKRQAAKKGIGFTALDNGFATVDDPVAVQKICDRLGPAQIDALLRKWLRRLPHPFTAADRAAGYRYEISVLQAEFSLTQVLDRPATGRIFFEQVIRDNLDLGRPDNVGLIFGHRIHSGRRVRTPGPFRTRVITAGVTPSLHVDYKSSTIKQYHKESIALRTETTINNPLDFRINKGLTNLPAMRKVGFQANRRLLHAEHISHDPATGAQAFTAVTTPTVAGGQQVAGLRFGDPRVHALLHVLLIFRLQPNGFTNAELRAHLTAMLGKDSRSWPPGRATYDLRRLRLHGLIERIPHTHRHRVTETGHHQAMFLTRVHDRVLRVGEAHLTDPQPPVPTPLHAAAHAYDRAVTQLLGSPPWPHET
jgi:hypothetical protein